VSGKSLFLFLSVAVRTPFLIPIPTHVHARTCARARARAHAHKTHWLNALLAERSSVHLPKATKMTKAVLVRAKKRANSTRRVSANS
jgi:hypothetical protein